VTLTATLTKSDETATATTTAAVIYTVLAWPDVTAPNVVSSTPANGASEVAWDTKQVTITFDEDVKNAVWGGNIWLARDLQIEGPDAPLVSGKADEDDLVITFSGLLKSEAEYTVTVPAGKVADKAGNVLGTPFE
jgi:methionine-rich copper-binding protein CopC